MLLLNFILVTSISKYYTFFRYILLASLNSVQESYLFAAHKPFRNYSDYPLHYPYPAINFFTLALLRRGG
jgi:hypothetical protein